jgi:hypothetical protein
MNAHISSAVEQIGRGIRSSRARWWFLAALVTLSLASLHTTPLHGQTSVWDAAFEMVRTVSSFALAAVCVGLARATVQGNVPVLMLAAMHGMYAMVIATIRLGGGTRTLTEVIVGGLLAMLGAALGAWLAAMLATKSIWRQP